jgi:hypothetical protein
VTPCPKPVKREPKPRRPLRRHTRLKAKGNTSHARRPRDTDYMGKVAKLPCVVRELVSHSVLAYNGCLCGGRIEVNHIGGRYGVDSDRNTVPMCREHHRDWTGRVGGGGYFAGWSPGRRRGWGAIAIAVTRAAVGR